MKFALKTTTLILAAALTASTVMAADGPIWPFGKNRRKAQKEQQAEMEAAERQALVERLVADSIKRLLAETAKTEALWG